MISLFLEADVKATEDLEKVKEALLNICPTAQIETVQNGSGVTLVRGRASGLDAITVLTHKFRDQRILEAVRQYLLKSIEDDTLHFSLHRQAALMNRFHLSDPGNVSAMGPIRVEIHAKNIRDVIDYISPPTIKGKPQYRKDLKLE